MERMDEGRRVRAMRSRRAFLGRIIWPLIIVIIFGGAVLFANGCGGGGGGGDVPKAENSDQNQNSNNPPADNSTATPPPNVKIAGVIELPKTGQTKCYNAAGTEIDCKDTGQDGDVQVGVVWPNPRFTDNGDGTVADNLTGLMWMKDANTKATRSNINCIMACPPPGAATWNEAVGYASQLNKENYLGHSDWRLPTVNELETLLNIGRWGYAFSAEHPFVGLQAGSYWSSTITNAGLNSWYVNFYTGGVSAIYNKEPSNRGYIWLARTAGNGLIKIAQVSNNKNNPTDIGEPWPIPRFIDSNNGTITDALTGLIWVKDMNIAKKPVTWQEALDYVAGMNAGTYPNLGYTDWRLPNRKELQSLHNRDRYSYFISGIPPFFISDTHNPYWSSTTIANSPEKAWAVKYVMASAGDPLELQMHNKALTLYFLPVRD